MGAVRGTGVSVRWQGQCKDCLREAGGPDAAFAYPDEWLVSTEQFGGTASDRCVKHRRQHRRLIKSLAVPYVDIETIGPVADREHPTGPLGGLGPLPTPHQRAEHQVDLESLAFGLTDDDVSGLLDALRDKQVAVVIAGTGSGKSTFLPYRLLYPPAGAALRLAERGPIVVTEPRREATRGTATMVAQVLCGVDGPGPGSPVGYRIGGEDRTVADNRLMFVTDGTMKNWLCDDRLDQFSTVIVDEAHELNTNIEFTLAYLASVLDRHPHLRVIIASATIDPQPFVDQFGGPDRVHVLTIDSPAKDFGYGHPLWPGEEFDPADDRWKHEHWEGVDIDGRPLLEVTAELADLRVLGPGAPPVQPGPGLQIWRDRMPKLVVEQVEKLVRGTEEGDVLAFLHGQKAVDDVVRQLTASLGDDGTVVVLPFTRPTPDRIKDKVRAPAQPGRRRVIVATNIAETSLTIDGLRFVVDTGLINQAQWDPDTATPSVPAAAHSQHGLQQRWGRVGRKAPGWVFPLYTRAQFQDRPQSTPPEATRSNLENLVVTAKAAGITELADLPFISTTATTFDQGFADTFDRELERAAGSLVARGALTPEGQLTRQGRDLRFGSDAASRRMAMVVADQLMCAVEMATALPLLDGRGVVGGVVHFRREWSPERCWLARLHHRSLALGCSDDLELALSVFDQWLRAPDPEEWARDQWADHAALESAAEQRLDLLRPLRQRTRAAEGEVRALDRHLLPKVRAALAAALPDLVLTRVDGRWQDVAGRPVELEPTALVGDAGEVLALSRRGMRGGLRCAGTVVLDGVPREQDPARLLAVLALGPRPERDRGGVDGLARVRERWPVGAVVRAVGAADEGIGLAGEVITAPEQPPPDEDDPLEEVGDTAVAAGDEEETEAEVEFDPWDDPDGVVNDDDPLDDGEPPLDVDDATEAVDAPVGADSTGPADGNTGDVPLHVDEAWADHVLTATDEWVVIGHACADESAPLGAVVVRPHVPPVGAPPSGGFDTDRGYTDVAAVVTEVAVGWGATSVEVVTVDGERGLLPGSDFSLTGRVPAAAPDLAPGDELRPAVVGWPGQPGGWRLSLRPALGRRLQGLVTVPVGPRKATGLRGRVVDLPQGQAVIRLDEETYHPVPLLVMASAGALPAGVAAGSPVAVVLYRPVKKGKSKGYVVPYTGPVPPQVDLDRLGVAHVDGTIGRASGNTVSARACTELLALSGDAAWQRAVWALWFKGLPTAISGVYPCEQTEHERTEQKPARNPRPRRSAPTLRRESVATGSVTAVEKSFIIVSLPRGRESLDVRVPAAKIGSGLLDARGAGLALEAPAEVTVDALRAGADHSRNYGSLPGIHVASLADQVVALLGGTTAELPVTKVLPKGKVLVAVGDGLRALVLDAGNGLSLGERIKATLSEAAFIPKHDDPRFLVPRIVMRRAAASEPTPGRYPARVVEVLARSVVVEFAGVRRSVIWRSIGDGQLEPQRLLDVGHELTAVVGPLREAKNGSTYNPVSLDVDTEDLATQATRLYGGRDLRGVIQPSPEHFPIVFVQIDPERNINGAVPRRAAVSLDAGDELMVRVRSVNLKRGKLEIDLEVV